MHTNDREKTSLLLQIKSVLRVRTTLTTLASLLFVLHQPLFSQSQNRIRLNQLGFYTYGPKVAVVVAPETWYFTIKSTDHATTYHTGEFSPLEQWSRSGEEVKSADFSTFTRKGTYVLDVAGIGPSYPFTIGNDRLDDLSRGLIKAFYYQRCSSALGAEAGPWKRAAGHPDRSVIVHKSAQSDPSRTGARSAGEAYPSPKGWYDAGDYGKYVVNAGISTYQLLLLYEQFADYFEMNNLAIPESGGALPDLLDEIKWELDWLLTMQDPADGGVYHKLTTKNFCGDIMPDAATSRRYFIGKGSAATFDFAAVLATAARVYTSFLPEFADSCLDAARKAWEWGQTYPDSTFSNPSDVVTGEYGDRGLRDELAWAGYELFCATGDTLYLDAARSANAGYQLPEWPKVAMLGYYSMALLHNDSAAVGRITSLADGLFARTESTPYRTTLSNEFYWGSNGVVANQGMALLVAFLLTNDTKYLEGALHAIDYLLGRNATGYCYVTGFGRRPPLHPHHRPSTADRVAAPVPGFLVGGPNAQANDGCDGTYSSFAAMSWRDEACSYSTNEVAINWNAPAAFLAGGISAVFSSGRFDLSSLRRKYGNDTVPPVDASLTVSAISSSQVTLSVTSVEPTVKTLVYATTPDFQTRRRDHLPRSDSATIVLSGLLPDKVYYYYCSSIDDYANNSDTPVDSFKTETGIELTTVIRHQCSHYRTGTPLTISFDHPDISSARLDYSVPGGTPTASLHFTSSGESFTVELPEEHITVAGIIYSFSLSDTAGTVTTPRWSIAPDSFSLSTERLGSLKQHTLISLPGRFPRKPSLPLFKPLFGDTTTWCFFGYDPEHSRYVRFDTLSPGSGGWLYSEKSRPYTHAAHALPPDTLFPVVLKRGWNIIGNPFVFPVYWSNAFIDCNGALLNVKDAAAFNYVHRQFYWYADTVINHLPSGSYRTNRDLSSHVFNDSSALEPWKAYWVYSQTDSTVLLLNPDQTIDSTLLMKQQTQSPRHWFLSVRAESAGGSDDPVVFGCSEAASNGFDLYDAPKPPSPSPDFSTAFIHDDWNTAARRFASDIAGIGTEKTCRWHLEIISSRKEPVTLSWNTDGDVPENLYLIDAENGSSVPMRTTGSYAFTPVNNDTRTTIEFALAPQFLPAMPSERYTFVRVPGSQISFSYTIPATGPDRQKSSITVFDLYGRVVGTSPLADRGPGTHRWTWDTRTPSGTTVASGIYLVRFSAGPFTRTISVNFSR